MKAIRAGWLLMLAGVLAGVLLPASGIGQAQTTSTMWREVYVRRNESDLAAGLARLYFIDVVTGEAVTADVSGERFTIAGDYVMFRDPATGTVYRAWPDGRVESHPFIQPAPETIRIDWVVSPNGEWLAWTLTNQTSGGLQTVTTLARTNGTEPRVILVDGPDPFLRVVPIALTNDWVFFFDRQPQGVGEYFFYRQYAAIHRLDVGAEAPEPRLLPFEPNCLCGAGISANGQYFARLEQVGDAGGFDVRLWDLPAAVDVFAPSLPVNYQAAGAVLVAPDGRRAVYSLANNLAVDSADSGRERFMLALVDASTGEQRALLYNQLLIPLLPVGWTDDGQNVLLVNPRQDGTWKLNIEAMQVRQVSSATWIGLLR
ncbi:MAG: hypothetical protein Kow0077_16440 [Anaerolineae bacterium]